MRSGSGIVASGDRMRINTFSRCPLSGQSRAKLPRVSRFVRICQAVECTHGEEVG